MASSVPSHARNEARSQYDAAEAHVSDVGRVLRALSTSILPFEPFEELAATALDCETKARAGLVRMGELRTVAVTGLDPKASGKAAELLEREAGIVAQHRETARSLVRRWCVARTDTEREAAQLLDRLDTLGAGLDSEKSAIDAVVEYIGEQEAAADTALLDEAAMSLAAVREELTPSPPRAASLVPAVDHARKQLAELAEFAQGRPARDKRRHELAVRGPTYRLEVMNNALCGAVERLEANTGRVREIERAPADGSETLLGLSAELLQQARRVRDDVRAAIVKDEPGHLREAANRLGELSDLLVEGEADLASLVDCWCAGHGEPGHARTSAAVAAEPSEEPEFPEASSSNLEPGEEAPDSAAPVAPAAALDPEDPAGETLPDPQAKTGRPRAAYRTTNDDDWDWDFLEADAQSEAASATAPADDDAATALAWADEVEGSGLPSAVRHAAALRAALSGPGPDGVDAALEAAQWELSAEVSDEIAALEQQPWLRDHPLRVELRDWIQRNAPNSTLQAQLSRAIDIDELLTDLEQRVSLIPMERDLVALRGAWTQATASQRLIEGLLTFLRKVDTRGW